MTLKLPDTITEEEFNLSEKRKTLIIKKYKSTPRGEVKTGEEKKYSYSEKDVKEFIKRVNLSSDLLCNFDNADYIIGIKAVLEIINQLAGEKLV